MSHVGRQNYIGLSYVYLGMSYVGRENCSGSCYVYLEKPHAVGDEIIIMGNNIIFLRQLCTWGSHV